jgi:copper ion binding protein
MHMPTITIRGMTCQKCVEVVEEALGRVDGVTAVQVDLDSATARYSEEKPVDMKDVIEAVREAGYEVA